MSMRRAILVGATLLFLQLSSASAHDFPAPSVTVTISNLTPNGHPDVRTEIDVPSGAGFDMLRIDSPEGTTIASDADIADGTVVGRLDGDATTNAITLPTCDVHTSFSVAIQEATTDRASSSYPAYLNDLAPGQHQLRLVADVSPSPDIPILINYLFDVEAPAGPIINDPSVGHVVTRVIVGNPLDPPEQFRSCTPTRSVNTLLGMTPDGVPLFTAGPTPFEGPLRFTFDFTSRPDEQGERHVQRVEAVAQTLSPPDDASNIIHPAPTDLRVTRNSARVLVLSWRYDVSDGAFQVDVIRASSGITSSLTSYASLSAEIPPELLPACPSEEQVTLRVMRISVAPGEPAAITVNPCNIVLGADTITAPSAGDGSTSTPPRGSGAIALVTVGTILLLAGVLLRPITRPRTCDDR